MVDEILEKGMRGDSGNGYSITPEHEEMADGIVLRALMNKIGALTAEPTRALKQLMKAWPASIKLVGQLQHSKRKGLSLVGSSSDGLEPSFPWRGRLLLTTHISPTAPLSKWLVQKIGGDDKRAFEVVKDKHVYKAAFYFIEPGLRDGRQPVWTRTKSRARTPHPSSGRTPAGIKRIRVLSPL